MEQRLVQDYLRSCQQQSREEFCKRVDVPILISEGSRGVLSFGLGQTRLTREQRKAPLGGELIRRCHQLPILELRQRLPGPAGQVRIGRNQENDLIISDNTVSSRHAVFKHRAQEGTHELQDLASMNGTWVNGNRLVVGRAVVLFDGDVIGFGDSMFIFMYPGGLYDVLRAGLSAL